MEYCILWETSSYTWQACDCYILKDIKLCHSNRFPGYICAEAGTNHPPTHPSAYTFHAHSDTIFHLLLIFVRHYDAGPRTLSTPLLWRHSMIFSIILLLFQHHSYCISSTLHSHIKLCKKNVWLSIIIYNHTFSDCRQSGVWPLGQAPLFSCVYFIQ